jgi:phospholipase C
MTQQIRRTWAFAMMAALIGQSVPPLRAGDGERTNGQGQPTTPPSHIANPNPQPGTDDVYTVDLNFDGNFTECENRSQPGIRPILDYLQTLPYRADPNCQPKHFYMINNDSPGFLPDGTVDTSGIASGGSIPPTDVRTPRRP